MADLYSATLDRPGGNPGAPARRIRPVTPSDSNDVTNSAGDNAPAYAVALYVGAAGNISIIAAGDASNAGQGTPVTFVAMPIGWVPIQVRRVRATGTTATSIVGLYDQ
jgi:hypothetical protein